VSAVFAAIDFLLSVPHDLWIRKRVCYPLHHSASALHVHKLCAIERRLTNPDIVNSLIYVELVKNLNKELYSASRANVLAFSNIIGISLTYWAYLTNIRKHLTYQMTGINSQTSSESTYHTKCANVTKYFAKSVNEFLRVS